jgi:hypothetical protein
MFRRADGDDLRWAKLGKDLAKSPTTRQQNASDALKVDQNVLPDVHESVPIKRATGP